MTTEMTESKPISPEMGRSIRIALIQQVIIGGLCLLMLDGGRAARVCGATVIGFWLGVLMLLARRRGRGRGSASDPEFLRWGFVPLLGIAGAMGQLWARFLGSR